MIFSIEENYKRKTKTKCAYKPQIQGKLSETKVYKDLKNVALNFKRNNKISQRPQNF